MTKSPKSIPSGARAPKVVLVSDALFFARSFPVTAGATPLEAAAQAELALEGLSPFPPAQLYHGYFWPAGAERALVFAAYRRRLTREQLAEWDGAALVLPVFAALLGVEAKPATTLLVASAEGLTAIYWDNGSVPAAVNFRPLPPEASEADRARVKDELLRLGGGSKQVVELKELPVAEAAPRGGDEFVFRADALVSRLPAVQAAAMDVRDKGELASLRRAQGRDLMLWRVFIGSVAALGLMLLGLVALAGAGLWERSRELKVASQQPVVDRIMTAQSLANRTNELSTKRLLPLEMLSVATEKKPSVIQFLRATTNGLYTLTVDAQTTSPNDVAAFRSALGEEPACAKVEVRDQRTRDNLMTFTLVITFKPDVLKPATAS
ncbi:MAG: hypothetical protein ABI222_05590 [Opitutaceae bacterium]